MKLLYGMAFVLVAIFGGLIGFTAFVFGSPLMVYRAIKYGDEALLDDEDRKQSRVRE